jgi:hypothetical protein
MFACKNRAKKFNYFEKPCPLSVDTISRGNTAMGIHKDNPAIVEQIT